MRESKSQNPTTKAQRHESLREVGNLRTFTNILSRLRTFNESVSPPLATKEEEIANKTSAVRQVLEVILRQLTNTRISP